MSFAPARFSPLSLGTLSAAAITALVIASGCTLKSREQRTLRIELPNTGSSQLVSHKDPLQGMLQGRTSSSLVAGTSLSGFNCYGLNVFAPDIPKDPRMSCRSTPVGRLGGLVSVENGVLEVEVPAGPARVVQLFAVTSTVGCPDLNWLLDQMHQTGGGPQGVGEPYMVGQAVVDVYDDTVVQITAKYDATSPRMFDGCTEPGVPPTAAYVGSLAVSPLPSPTPTAAPLNMVPGAGIGAPELTAPDNSAGGFAVGPTELDVFKMRLSEYDFSNPDVNIAVQGISGSMGKRAVIQLQWDVTDLDLAANPYASLELQMRGGAEGAGCPAVSYNWPYGVSAGIYYPAGGYFIPVGEHRYWNGDVRWGWGGTNRIAVNAAELAFTKSDGRKYVIVNVESNFAAASTGNCSSITRVARASLRLTPYPQTNSGGIWPIQIGALAERSYYGGAEFLLESSQSVTFYATGGIAPYAWSVLRSDATAAASTIDPRTGHLVAGAAAESLVVKAIDAVGTIKTLTVNVAPSGTPLKVNLSVPTTMSAGSCVSVGASLVSFNGTSGTNHAGTNLNVHAYDPAGNGYFAGPAGSFYSDPSCSTALSSQQITISAGSSFGSAYFRPEKAGMGMKLDAYSGLIGGQSAPFTVSPGVANRMGISGPRVFNQGSCVWFDFFLADAWGNFLPNDATYTGFDLILGSTATNAYFYGGCGGSPWSGNMVGFPGNGASAPWGLGFQGADVGNFTVSITPTTSPSPGPGSLPIQIVPAGDATRLQFPWGNPSTAAANSCVPMSLQLQDSNGAAANVPWGTWLNLGLWAEGAQVYTDSGCTSPLTSSLAISPTPPGSMISFYVRTGGSGSSIQIKTDARVNDGTSDLYSLAQPTWTLTVP